MVIFVFTVPQHPQQPHGREGQGGKMQERDSGILGNGSQHIVEGIQITAVPLREAQLPGKHIMHLGHRWDFGAINDDLFHLGLSIEHLEALVVGIGVLNQAVVGEDDTLGTPAVAAQGINIAFGPLTTRSIREQTLVIAEAVAADALAGGIVFQTAALPA